MRVRPPLPRPALAAAGALALTAAGCGPDAGQMQICERVLLALVDEPASVRVLERRSGEAHAVVIDFTQAVPEGPAQQGRIACGFAGGRFDDGRLTLDSVETGELGRLTGLSLAVLKRRLSLR